MGYNLVHVEKALYYKMNKNELKANCSSNIVSVN